VRPHPVQSTRLEFLILEIAFSKSSIFAPALHPASLAKKHLPKGMVHGKAPSLNPWDEYPYRQSSIT
jgi:hypothetical protein